MSFGKNKFRKVMIIFLFIFSGCSSPEKSKLCVFLENVMIRDGGLYVLMGSKPMSTFSIEDSGFPETEEEIRQAYDLYLFEIASQHMKDPPISYDAFSDDCHNQTHLHFRKLWECVHENLENLVGPRYLFVVRRNPFGKQRKCGLFINVPNALFTLKHYYREFSEIYGAPFDPERVLLEISDSNSFFWNSLFNSNYAQGLLFGYGMQNSFEFDWQLKSGCFLQRIKIDGQHIVPLTDKTIEASDLGLPTMSVYSLSDRKISKYRRERRKILNELKGKNFEQTVIHWLSNGRKQETGE